MKLTVSPFGSLPVTVKERVPCSAPDRFPMGERTGAAFADRTVIVKVRAAERARPASPFPLSVTVSVTV